MSLTGKQKRVLRSLGQVIEPLVHVGKEGVSESTVAATNEVLAKRELIKVRVLKTVGIEEKDVAAELAAATGSDVAGMVGHTFLLYRPNPELEHRITLPPAREAE